MPAAEISYGGPMHWQSKFRATPVTFILLLVSAMVFVLVDVLRMTVILSWFNYVPLVATPRGWSLSPPNGDLWRFFTPALLHFSWTHLIFNSLWIWEFGQRIERRIGPILMLVALLLVGCFANYVQYSWEGASVFGGLSGVVYGWLGFLVAGRLLYPCWLTQPPDGLVIFMVVWLFIGLSGGLSVLGLGEIANGAHFGGLLGGFMVGSALALLARSQARRMRR